MLGGNKIIRNLDHIRRATPNIGLGSKIEARAWRDTAWSTIYDNKMTQDRPLSDAVLTGGGRPFQIARNGNDYLHKKKVEENNEQDSQNE